MCGICGIVDFNSQIKPSEREKMVRTMNENIVHRGPDEEGFLQ